MLFAYEQKVGKDPIKIIKFYTKFPGKIFYQQGQWSIETTRNLPYLLLPMKAILQIYVKIKLQI